MDRDDIIRMAREAGFAIQGDMYGEDNEIARVERFAKLVEAAEREACAKVCDARDAAYCAFSIRERGAP